MSRIGQHGFSTVSPATATTGASYCPAFANPVVKWDHPSYQQEPLEMLSLEDPDLFDSVNQYIWKQSDISSVSYY